MGKKEDKFTALKGLFHKQKILVIDDLFKVLNTKNRKSVHLYLKQIDYLTSYSHGGMYYTLKENISFDDEGIWHCGNIGFSKYGTLVNTIIHLVKESEAGKTGSELQKQCRVRVQNALLDLVQANKIDREKLTGKLFVYLNSEFEKRQKQLTVRQERKILYPMPEWVVIEILVEIIRTSFEEISLDKVACRLKKRGSSITKEQVSNVFNVYDLEKKTPDCTP